MRIINPFAFDDESNDYNEFILSADENSTLDHLLILVIIFGINFMIGCAITIVFFKIKGYLARFFQILCCGLCDECDCEYDGTYASRSMSLKYRRPKTKTSPDPRTLLDEESILCDCSDSLYYTWLFSSRWIKSGRGKKMAFLFLGLCAGSVLSDILYPDAKEPVTLIHSSGHSAFLPDDSDSADPSRIFFVTPTIMSGIQGARLTRIGQALYPLRHRITWVVVSTDPVRTYHWSGTRTEHWSHGQIHRWKNNQTRVMEHLEDVRHLLERFGVPYVILSGHSLHHMGKGFGHLPELDQVRAAHVGITWVAKMFMKGTFLLGPEDGAYNFHLFNEIQGTKLMSTWPTYSQLRFVLGLNTPVPSEPDEKALVKGYFEGGRLRSLGIPLQLGNYALNVSLLRSLRSKDLNALKKLSLPNNGYTSEDLGVSQNDIQYFGNNCSDIYVWQLAHAFSRLYDISSKKIPLKDTWIDTNVENILTIIKKWYALDLVHFKSS